ncbi:hypothetical protein [Hymenobacter cheonanensis]|uniref:hypothetical protein n=1 Tax=Hymenobacter sp. CA2-7 TaxID=3063993 RepID=UPI002713318B|nr:hypothetical protein [Hymenobacter sp. CA2-7]MDO7887658.1 hypothetical protein [Hymenobacter sp. CA2-7]
MKPLFVLAAALLHTAAAAQVVATAATRPQAGIARTLAARALPYTQPVAGGGSITYFGTVCSHDCQHEQFARLRQAFEAARPTIVYFENPAQPLDSTETAVISRLGEGGYIRYLAQEHQVPAERLNDALAEYAYLQTRLDPERLKLFCLLREVQRFRARTGGSKALTKKAMQAFLAHSAFFLPGTDGVIRNQAELETAYRRYCPAGSKWWDAPAAWFNPATTEASLSNPSIEEFKAAIREFRAQTLYGKLVAQAQAGQRVFVVLSRDNLPLVGQPLANR